MSNTKTPAAPFGLLVRYQTGEVLRPATEHERDRSRRAAVQDGRGLFQMGSLTVWVSE